MIIDNMNIVIDKTDPYYEDVKKYFYKVVDEEIRPLYRIDEDEEVLIINRGLKFLLPKSMLNDVEDYTTNDIDIDVKQDPEFYRNILDGITLRDDQILAVMKCLTHKRGICQLPTGCFVADTPVMTLLGKSKSIKSLVDDYNNGIKNYVYSCTEDGTIVPGEVIGGQLTKYVNKLYELTLDNGEVIRCTPDHPFMLRNGSYKHAEDLLMTDSLMPITVYRKDVDTISDELYYTGHPHLHERLFIKHPNSSGLQLVHTMVTRNYYPDVAYESGKSVHHIDHNPDNNYPENLLVMNTLDHDKLHLSEGRNTRWNGPNNEYYRELERQRLSNRNKNNWKNNDYRKRMSKIISKNSKNSKMVNELNYNSDFQFSTRKGKVLSYINYMITKFGKDNITIDNFEELSYSLTEYRQHVRLDGIAKVYDCSTPHPKGRRYNGINYNKLRELWDLILDEASLYNHKIIKVEVVELEEPIPVYDIEVKDYHNFAVGSNKSGVFVHNCGKTIIIAAIIKYYGMMLGYYPTTLIFEPTNYLVNEMIERFNSYGIPATKYSDHRQSVEGVTISHPMSLYNDLQKDDELFNEVKIFIGDECLPKSAEILLGDGKTITTMENIYNDESIDEVMSYNLETNTYEPKKILRRFKKEYNKQFWKVYYIHPITGEKLGIVATPNHKIWTYNRGYVQVQDLTTDDYIKVDISEKKWIESKYICPYCGKELSSGNGLGGHVSYCEKGPHREKSLNSKRQAVINGNWISPFEDPKVFKKAMTTRSNNDEYRKYLSDRMKGDKNPSKNPEVIKKQQESRSKLYKNNPDKLEERKRNYIRSAHHDDHVTDLEQMIIDLNIPGLEFTGNTSIIILADGMRKMPDFTYTNGDEVKYIEISSMHWYDHEYIDYIRDNYKNAGYDLLYLTDDDLDNYELRIHKFLFNHKVKVHEIRKSVGRVAQYKYNIEVADNHNYFADNVLVSNCHHQSCNTWSTIYNSLNSIEVSLGFSASIIDQSKIPVVRLSDLTYEEAVIFGCTGNIIMNLPTSYFIKIGVLAIPVLFRMSNAASEWVYDDRNWHQLMQKKLESNARTKIVCDCTTLFNILDFKTLIIVSTKRYAEKIIRKLDEYHIKDKCVLSYGSGVYLKLNDNNELVDCRDEDPKSKFSSGELNIMIATTHLLEGVDVPNLDVVILPQIGKKDRRIIQGIGRALRKTKHGHYAYIIDFDDYTSGVLKYQSDTRMKMYKEVIGIKECDIYDHFSLSSMKQVVKRLENI